MPAAVYAEQDSASDSSFEDGRHTQHAPLLPLQSWSPTAFKESFQLPSSPTVPAWAVKLPFPLPPILRRRCFLLAVILLATLGSIPLLLWAKMDPRELERVPEKLGVNPPPPMPIAASPQAQTTDDAEATHGEDALPVHLRPDTYLEGWAATTHFRDSLRNDTGYMTSFLSAGWTNDQITVVRISHLVVPCPHLTVFAGEPDIPRSDLGTHPYSPAVHLPHRHGRIPLPFSDIFDVPRMVSALNAPILEWHMVKDLERAHAEDVKDEIGCWNIWEVDNVPSDGPRGSYTTTLLNLDISYTRAPASVKLIPNFEHDSHSTFWSLAKLAFPEEPDEVVGGNHVVLPPDEQLVCYDYLYYVCALDPFEFERDYSPMWREVMVHAHWTESLQDLARGYLRRMFRLAEGAAIPPYIAIHARRGDFAGWCGDVPREECFAPLGAFARRVAEVQEALRARHGVYVSHVVMTGDERDQVWWQAVEERGWLRVDHDTERTAERFGKWYPVVLDAVVQSMSVGFVGTDRSTFSHMARRRVEDWNHGVTRLVKWGFPGADDH
ncbi:hypothetical protein BD413DRAFT_626744 [Trametes elegans]|nr:hypothetical protein BD413DRAFT_626744 [Trametes elegans]